MSENTDTLAEACKVAGITGAEEVQIAELEKMIADKIRAVTKKIFSENKFRRLQTQRVNVEWGSDDGIVVYSDIGCVLINNIHVSENCEFFGTAKTLRVTPAGDIIYVWQMLPGRCSQYNLFGKSDWGPALDDCQRVLPWGNASDHDIATHAQEIASDLITTLKKRIDSCSAEKKVLQAIAEKI